jgi:oligopeptide/dipeptide ABC transporter ATP-binding protein
VTPSPPLLEFRQVAKQFRQRDDSLLRAVSGVDLTIDREECVALVGESGSGKSTLARLALRLLQPDAGEILYRGRSIAGMGGAELRDFRRSIQPVFQDTAATFNPRRTVRDTLGQALRQASVARRDVEPRARGLLESVRLPATAEILDRYPHELSGGQRQRLAIARAIAMEPALIIADEPLSGADASIRGQILNLLADLGQERRVAYLFITHDLSIARAFARRVAVIYRGLIVEEGPTAEVLRRPTHPYTQLLLASAPTLDGSVDLTGITSVARGSSAGAGCVFWPRCPVAVDVCEATPPPLVATPATGHRVACHLAGRTGR